MLVAWKSGKNNFAKETDGTDFIRSKSVKQMHKNISIENLNFTSKRKRIVIDIHYHTQWLSEHKFKHPYEQTMNQTGVSVVLTSGL